jgi:hypothetical protein
MIEIFNIGSHNIKSFQVDSDVICCVQTSAISPSSNELITESSFRYLMFWLWMNRLNYSNKIIQLLGGCTILLPAFQVQVPKWTGDSGSNPERAMDINSFGCKRHN